MVKVRLVVSLFIVLVLTGPALSQPGPVNPVYYKVSTDALPVPDVNKSNPGNTNDGTCWLAVAANTLGAAGYGAGPDSWTRAQNIYTNQLIPGLAPTLGGGDPAEAITWWLNTYGKNPDSIEYQPNNPYTDLTAFYGSVTQSQVNFLYGELERCQYVGVNFQNKQHAMTLVGFDTNQGTSTWHDSDVSFGTVPANPGDDHYANHYTGTNNSLSLYDTSQSQYYVQSANGYQMLCPGLNKPEDAVRNYDVSYFKANLTAGFLESGAKAIDFTDPVWDSNGYVDPDDQQTYPMVRIGNQFDPVLKKEIYLLVDYYDRNAGYLNETIRLRYQDEFGMLVIESPTSVELSDDNGQALFTWKLDNQPDWEEIIFPSYDYVTLEGIVSSWDVATICVPEPAAMSLLVLGGIALLRRRR